MKVKTLLAAIIGSGFESNNSRFWPEEEVAKRANDIAENIMKRNGECMDEQIALFIPGEPG